MNEFKVTIKTGQPWKHTDCGKALIGVYSCGPCECRMPKPREHVFINKLQGLADGEYLMNLTFDENDDLTWVVERL